MNPIYIVEFVDYEYFDYLDEFEYFAVLDSDQTTVNIRRTIINSISKGIIKYNKI